MKLLFLSICGKLNEPEETKYINLFLASLKKNVVPYFETNVVLLTTYKIENMEHSLLKKRIEEYELQNNVHLKTIYDLDLPKKSLDIINDIDWFNRIGIHMNILYDYAKRNNFFEADWLFHIDTDCEFLDNFQKCINNIDTLRNIHPNIIISLAGDSYPMNLIYDGVEYIFEEPNRIYFYNENEVERPEWQLKIKENNLDENDHRKKYISSVFSPFQMKVRNDFVGISREATNIADFNWVFMYYDYEFKDNGPIQKFWPDKAFKKDENGKLYEIAVPQIHVNFHMGGMLQYKLHSNQLSIVRVQLPGYTHAVLHYNSGWFNGNFVEKSFESLSSKYEETKNIWEKDY